MKRLLLLAMLLSISMMNVNAQILRTDELEEYAKEKYGNNWTEAANNIASQITLDKNNGITITQIVPVEGKTKEQLYVILNYWFTSTFNDANSVINLNDKELGTIIAQGFVKTIAYHKGGTNAYDVSIKPVIKCDIKDEKVRVTYTVPFYSVIKIKGGGIMGDRRFPKSVEENWTLDSCYPFVKSDSHKKTSCKALVMAHAYSNVVMDKLEECIKNGLSGNETEDW